MHFARTLDNLACAGKSMCGKGAADIPGQHAWVMQGDDRGVYGSFRPLASPVPELVGAY